MPRPVKLGETLVGALTHLGNEAVIFAFDHTYVEAGSDRPTLSLSFKAADGGLVEQTRPTRVRLSPVFSNLLPEAHLRQYLAARGGVHPDREFFLIGLLGADLPGAIEIRALDGMRPPTDDQAREATFGRPATLSILPGRGSTEVLRPDGDVEGVDRTGRWHRWRLDREAAVATQDIGGLPQDLPEAFGQSLAVRRFDRPSSGQRVHIEDFAQVFGVYPEDKYRRASYGSVGRVLWLEIGEEAVVEYTRRLAFSVLIGNADAHLKNWSLIYPDGRTPKLAPAYDFVATVPYLPEDRLALSLGETKVFAEVNLERFRRFSEKAGLPVRLVVQTARETAQRVLNANYANDGRWR